MTDHTLFLKRFAISKEETYLDVNKRAIKAVWDNIADLDLITLLKLIESECISLPTPMLAIKSLRDLPSSCFLQTRNDDTYDLIDGMAETAKLAVSGGGVSINFSNIRASGSPVKKGLATTTGSIPFIVQSAQLTNTYKQFLTLGNTSDRNTALCCYMSISHGDFYDFIHLKHPNKSKYTETLSTGFNQCITITDYEMNMIVQELDSELCKRYDLLMDMSWTYGQPYILWTENANEKRTEFQKANDISINSSNLCTEILLPSNQDRTATCCLININLENYPDSPIDELTVIVELGRHMLLYIEKNTLLESVRTGIRKDRSIGLCLSNFYGHLIAKKIPVEGERPYAEVDNIFGSYKTKLQTINQKFAIKYPNECAEEADYYFTKMTCIPPNSSTRKAMYMTCLGVNPLMHNISTTSTSSTIEKFKNKHLNLTEEQWLSVSKNNGSVQHLDIENKEVYKIASEMDQVYLISIASLINSYLDHTCSFDLYRTKKTTMQEFKDWHRIMWLHGLVTRYYVQSFNEIDATDFTCSLDMGDCDSCSM